MAPGASFAMDNMRFANMFMNDENGIGIKMMRKGEPILPSLVLLSQYHPMNRRAFGLKNKEKNGIQRKSFFTSVEQALYKAILSRRFPYDFWAQYMINGDQRMRVDGAFPQIKLIVEADGREWHSDKESIEKDKRRDSYLSSQGWTVLRFTEEEIEKKLNDVIAVISQAIRNKSQNMSGTSPLAQRM